MRVTQIIADLHVPDLKAAKGFYTDYPGLTEEEFNPSTTACGPRPCGSRTSRTRTGPAR